ncbi:DUF4892 domain-containing protein [Pseudomonas sp. PS1]|uniref:DUF4892 domain-containing protein n=1 Tax=Stutzerimonas marianensis TaxID=2929513 RepID=A0A9X2ARX4_9GAMM|nr:DUF4892 domain-containing protein [Pseudomonas marianensis]MCJ0973369.1 DUF4892 domain-containing protein [Pseudomonas marianensis]
MRGTWIAPLALFSMATLAADVPGSTDFEALPRYPQAEIVGFKEQQVVERTYPLDSIRRISGRLRMADQVSAPGELTAVTYLLPSVHTGIEAFEKSRRDLLAAGGELLYWCEGRECGSSSLWANDVFQRAMLYGPDAQQAFLLARMPGEADELMALYGITRGNGRPYLQVERLRPERPLGVILPNPATLLRQLKTTGELRLARLPDEPTAEWGALLANVLRLDSTMRIELIGSGAAAWLEALRAERVKPRRIDAVDSDEPGLVIRLLR